MGGLPTVAPPDESGEGEELASSLWHRVSADHQTGEAVMLHCDVADAARVAALATDGRSPLAHG